MSEDQPLSADLKATEALLAALRPQAPTIDRDRLMYEAGAAAARAPLGRAVPLRFGFAIRSVATIAGLAASLLLGVWIGDQRTVDVQNFVGRPKPEVEMPPPDVVGPIDGELATARDAEPRPVSPDSYFALRKQLAALETDFATLPASAAHDGEPNTTPSLRRQQADWLRALN